MNRLSRRRTVLLATMANQGSTTSYGTAKQPPQPSPLRNSKFFQANMRILVTGGAGFIGSHSVDKLIENENNEVKLRDGLPLMDDDFRQRLGMPSEF